LTWERRHPACLSEAQLFEGRQDACAPRRLSWERHGKCAALPRWANQLDRSFMSLSHPLCYGQAKSASAVRARARLFHAVEPLEYMRRIIRGYANSSIGNENLSVATFACKLNRYGT